MIGFQVERRDAAHFPRRQALEVQPFAAREGGGAANHDFDVFQRRIARVGERQRTQYREVVLDRRVSRRRVGLNVDMQGG